jgi:hypothetical protein
MTCPIYPPSGICRYANPRRTEKVDCDDQGLLIDMSMEETLKRGEEALECFRRAVYDEMVKKARLGQFAIVNRNNKPYKIKASKAVRLIEEARAKRGEIPYR